MISSDIHTIKNLPLFHGIEENELVSMLQCLAPKTYEYNKDQCIVNSGERLDKFGIILEGEAAVSKEDIDGNRVILSVVKKGDLFGEMLVFSSCDICPVTVRAQSSCKVLFLTNSSLITRCGNMCSCHTTLLQNFLEILSNKGLMLNTKVKYLSIKSIRGKVASYILDQYSRTKSTTVTLPLNRSRLADFLNVSRPSMSREICKMRDEGIIDFHLSTFKIKDIEALKSFCE
ncbi:Crp/Fnr family transcriptional regulator [Clostridium sp. cel8]|jgi:CRP/FNR family transcriptional regulator, dissimilatory nitrate respiration regulator|uniref:Crp/Fnr family transcriptional regulator n=1 Tax=Clostridium sp. cel8 TaxID=2663123 RepID=UPI0015F6BA98|nr:Crp/Fnr family transcriptional regulator [Clostridium sp. cel8]MBA5851524.1 Crp/Fnr family transcriptional regulator [Clostridium sp. cel8]